MLTHVLGIESSCDETGLALVCYDDRQGWPRLLGHVLHSQASMHAEYGGVVPELASRDHIRHVAPLLEQLLTKTGLKRQHIDCVAYTRGPGLAGALLVGAGFATALAAGLQRPVLPVHHLEGHVLSPFLDADPPEFPFVALLVSGGHTQLIRVDGVGRYQLLGESLDDAAGEAFDKSAKLMGLVYPGGPELARLAAHGNPDVFSLPRPLLRSKDLNFSFSGLKTAVLTQVRGQPEDASRQWLADLAASTQQAIVDVLLAKSASALRQTGIQRLVVVGGVAANQSLRQQLRQTCRREGWKLHFPQPQLCTDNGAMIAIAAAMRLQTGISQAVDNYAFDVMPRWPWKHAANEGFVLA